MADTPKLVSSMGRAELDRIFVRDYDLNKNLLGKITFAQMVYLMLEGRLPTPEQGRMIDAMLIVLVDHGMTTGAAAARMTFHSAPEAIQGAVAAAILGAGSVHLGSSEHCAKMLNDALPKDSQESDLDTVALRTVEKRLANQQLIPGIGHGIHTGGDPRGSFDAAYAIAAATDARLEHAISAYARARILAAVGDADAADAREDADRQLSAMGLRADGWRRVFDIATDGVTARS